MSSTIYSSRNHRIILLGLIIGLGIFLFYELRELVSAILGAIVMYTLFKPFYEVLHSNRNWKGSISALVIIFLSLIIIVLPFIGFSLMVMERISDFQSKPFAINQFLQKINDVASKQFHDPQFVQHKLQFIQSWGLTLFSQMINSLFKTIFTIAIMYFIFFFMLTQNEIFESTIERYLPFREKSTTLLKNELRNITFSNLLGQGLIGIIQGICVMLAFLIFKLPDPFFWGVIAGFLSFIPVFGVPSIFVGASIFCFANGNNLAGAGLLLWGFIVIAFVENYMRMLIARKVANAHPLITIIGILIGLPAFGIVGIVFGPLLLSYFFLLISIYERKYLLPESSGEKTTLTKIENLSEKMK